MQQTTLVATIREIAPMLVAYMPMHGSFAQMPQAFGALYGWLGEHHLTPSGPPLGVYFTDPKTTPAEQNAWEVWAPITAGVAVLPDSAGIGIKGIPETTMATTTFVGAYERMEPVYAEFGRWIADQGYQIAGPSQEVYLSDPETTTPDQYVTEIRFPVLPK